MADFSKLDTVTGKPLDRVDGRLKVTGGAKYAGEFSVPNMAYGVLLQSTIAKGKVTGIDSADALKAPGVIAVITDQNMPKVNSPKGRPSGITHPYLSWDIDHSGQNVAIVVAETFEQAEYGASLVKVAYDASQPNVVMDTMLDQAYTSQGGRMPEAKRGDFDSAYPSTSLKVDQIYRTPNEHHNPMEPHATISMWDAEDHVTAYDATQGVSGSASAIASCFGLKPNQVHIIDPFVGGGFGCKGLSWPHAALSAVASKVVGRPVKITLSRKQMFTSNGHRPATRQAMKLGAGADGKLLALEGDMINDTSQTDDFVEPTGSVPVMLYSCANVHIRHRLVKVDLPNGTFMRAPGESSGSFGIETAMDELAYLSKVDPLELRLRNYAETDESIGKDFSSKNLKECYRQGAEKFGWSSRKPEPRSMRKGDLLVGYGMATATYPASVQPASARATMNADGSVLFQCGTQDLGTGTYTILTQIGADGVGVPVNKVRVQIGDSTLPPAPGSGGSTSAASAGSAVMEAAQALKAALLNMATADTNSPLHGVSVDDLVVTDGVVSLKSAPTKKVTYESILASSGQRSAVQEVRTQGRPKDPSGKGLSYHSFGAQFCEVHIDPDTCMIRVARWVGAFAVGRILNEKTLRSQLQGGVIFGIGMGLLEETVADAKYGRYLNTNLAEYHVPVNRDVPDIDIIMVEGDDRLASPVGAKGAGEIGITGVAAAIGNAVYHATGKRVRDLPITLDKIL